VQVSKCDYSSAANSVRTSPNGSGYNTSYCQYINASIIPVIPAFPSFQLSGRSSFLSFYVSSRRSGHRKLKEQKGDAYRTISPRIALKGDHLLILLYRAETKICLFLRNMHGQKANKPRSLFFPQINTER